MSKPVLLCLLCLLPLFAHAGQPAPGDIPPPALGIDHEGNTVDLGQLRGKVVIVTFWASWCPPCRKELPVLGHFQKVVGRDALEVVAINRMEHKRIFRDGIRQNRDIALTWVHDAKGEIGDQYGVSSLPNMFIIDRDGVIAHTHRGYSERMLPQIVEEVIGLLPEDVRNRPAGDAG